MKVQRGPSKSLKGRRAQGYLRKLRESIARKGGIFPGKNKDGVIAVLRKTRAEVWEDKFAHRPGH